MTIPEQLEELAEEICNKYCKYPDTWDEEKEGVQLCESEICAECPLNRILGGRGMKREEAITKYIVPAIERTWNEKICKEILEALKQEPKWIPMKTRPMTEEEREYYREWSDVDEAMIFDCKLPEDGQEVLVSYGGYVCVDTFCNDDGCYFDGVDIDDVDAWMPLPTPFEPQERSGKE